MNSDAEDAPGGTDMDDRGILELLQAMVRAPSHPGVPRQEEAAARELDAYLRENAGSPRARRGPRRPAERPRDPRRAAGPVRISSSAGTWTRSRPTPARPSTSFPPKVEDGRMFGRGTVDMKGALAAMARALAGIRESGGLEAGRVTLAAVIDEEMESLGAEALIRSGFKADGCVIGEPTENRVAIGHKGLEWLEVDVHRPGRPRQHARRPASAPSSRRGPLRLARRDRARPRVRAARGTPSWASRPSTWARSRAASSRAWSPPTAASSSIAAGSRRKRSSRSSPTSKTLLARVREARPGLKTTPGAHARRHGHDGPRPAGHRSRATRSSVARPGRSRT
ncbi:MAG: M20/M25/M40 family metallo-hydrolase [Sphingobacterium sp.]|nr:M20/M25/M40 family metallo-hydrolase [Sphingobacterium sp.]